MTSKQSNYSKQEETLIELNHLTKADFEKISNSISPRDYDRFRRLKEAYVSRRLERQTAVLQKEYFDATASQNPNNLDGQGELENT